MLNRDFTKSGKQYIKQNKFVLIALAVILTLGVIMLCVCGGFKGGADVSGCTTFSINIGSNYEVDDLDDQIEIVNDKLIENKAELLSVQLTGEGDATTLVVKYLGTVKDIDDFNFDIAKKLEISALNISEHTKLSASLKSSNYLYAVVCGLIILSVAVVYIAVRYNLACAITALGGAALGVATLMAVTSIFRLTINSSFLAINIITLLLILGESFMLFDTLEKEREKLDNKNDRSTQLINSLKVNSFRQKFMYGALFALALVFVVLMPLTIKQASLVLLFAVVAILFATVYVLPFLWCLTITQVSDKIRVKKVKNTKVEQTVEQVEGELEQNYTENQVIEVKEDNGDETPSNDDTVTIE